MFSQHQVDGFLITPAKGMEKEIRMIASEEKPVVLIDSYLPDEAIPHVAVDNFQGVMLGMDHLFERGYKNIAFVTVDLPLVQIQERTRAFRESLEARKVKKIGDQILEVPFESTGEEVCEYVKKFLRKRKSTDAVFFATNYLGIPGLDCIQQEGFQIPHEIAMICFDDHELFRLFPRGITAIRQPIDEIAETAFQLLMNQIKGIGGDKKTSQIKLAPRLIARGST
jgi:LacI family transcriptional regulator